MLDLWRGRLSVRKAITLLEHLPAGSELLQRLSSDGAWSIEAHLLRVLAIAATGSDIPTPSQSAVRDARLERTRLRAEARRSRMDSGEGAVIRGRR